MQKLPRKKLFGCDINLAPINHEKAFSLKAQRCDIQFGYNSFLDIMLEV